MCTLPCASLLHASAGADSPESRTALRRWLGVQQDRGAEGCLAVSCTLQATLDALGGGPRRACEFEQEEESSTDASC